MIKNINIVEVIESIILILLILVFFSLFCYSDLYTTTYHGMNVWSCIFSNNLRNFYIINADPQFVCERLGYSTAAVYDFSFYILFAIYDLPLWIYEHFTGNYALDTAIGLLYAKSISIPFLLIIYIYIKKIMRSINNNMEITWTESILLFLSSAFLITPVYLMGCYDSVSVALSTIAVYHFINNRKNLFILFIGLSILFKPFALFIAIPLLLIKEKRVIVLVHDLFKIMIGLLCIKVSEKLYFEFNDYISSYTGSMTENFLTKNNIAFNIGEMSVFFFLFIGYIIYCYFCVDINKINDEIRGKVILYYCYVGCAIFLVGAYAHPQWYILLFPYSIMLVLYRGKDEYEIGLLLDTMIGFGVLAIHIVSFSWIYSVCEARWGVLSSVFVDNEKIIYYSIMDAVSKYINVWEKIDTICVAIFMSSIIAFCIWANPERKMNQIFNVDKSISRYVIYGIRGAVLAGLIVVLLWIL